MDFYSQSSQQSWSVWAELQRDEGTGGSGYRLQSLKLQQKSEIKHASQCQYKTTLAAHCVSSKINPSTFSRTDKQTNKSINKQTKMTGQSRRYKSELSPSILQTAMAELRFCPIPSAKRLRGFWFLWFVLYTRSQMF